MTLYRFRVLLAGGIFVLLVFAVLAFGAVDTWALSILELGAFALAAFMAIQMIFAGWRPVWNGIYIPWAVVALWTGLQAFLGLSVYVYRTEIQALKWLALGAVFFMASQAFADESIRSRFNLALMWFGCGLCVLGLIQYFTARNFIFWMVPVVAGKVFGPFVNANQFTAWIELLRPAALLLALRPVP